MKHFRNTEFTMGGENVFDKMNKHLLEQLDELREFVNEPLKINSSYRSLDYNRSIGGSTKSQHLTGNAVDLHCDNGTLRGKIVHHALNLGLSVGIAKSFIHVDNRDNQIVFTY